jgi:hypothetical protein
MSVFDQLTQELKDSPPHNFDPAAFLIHCAEKFDAACSSGNALDPRERSKAELACNEYGAVAQLFHVNGFSFAAESLLIGAWNKFGQIQFNERNRIYRAGIAQYLVKLYLHLGDRGAALRWALHTQADDMLGEHSTGGGAGRQTLLTILRMSSQALAEFNDIAARNLELVRSESGNDWSCPPAFAEDVVRRFALEKRKFADLFAVETSLNEFPLSPAYFSSLYNRVNSEHPNTTSQGKALEDLASYIFLLIPGWVPRQNVLDELEAYETDLVIRNLNTAGNLTAELLGRHFIVECKNSRRAVGVPDVGYFLYRMRLTHSRFGIIFATNDISGAARRDTEDWRAYQLVRKSFHEDGSVCIVVNNGDLNQLSEGETTGWSLILERIERMRFGNPRRTSG